jgi:hypothetical protein
VVRRMGRRPCDGASAPNAALEEVPPNDYPNRWDLNTSATIAAQHLEFGTNLLLFARFLT